MFDTIVSTNSNDYRNGVNRATPRPVHQPTFHKGDLGPWNQAAHWSWRKDSGRGGGNQVEGNDKWKTLIQNSSRALCKRDWPLRDLPLGS